MSSIIVFKSSIFLHKTLAPKLTLNKCSVEGLKVKILFLTDAHSDCTPPESDITYIEYFKFHAILFMHT